MRELTASTLGEAMTLCSQHADYSVYIVFDKRSRLKEFIDDIKEIGTAPGIKRSVVKNDYAEFRFYNDSVIRVDYLSEQRLRGVRCNNVLVSSVDELSGDEKMTLRQMERPYRSTEEQNLRDAVLFATEFGALDAVERMKSEPWKPTESEDESSEELDEFLSEFTVSENRE